MRCSNVLLLPPPLPLAPCTLHPCTHPHFFVSRVRTCVALVQLSGVAYCPGPGISMLCSGAYPSHRLAFDTNELEAFFAPGRLRKTKKKGRSTWRMNGLLPQEGGDKASGTHMNHAHTLIRGKKQCTDTNNNKRTLNMHELDTEKFKNSIFSPLKQSTQNMYLGSRG